MNRSLARIEVRAEGRESNPSKVLAISTPRGNGAAQEYRRSQIHAGLEFYRKYTEVMLRRYQRLSLRAGRMPSVLGQDVFRGRTSTYRIHSFEDAVIFVYDMERCMEKIGDFERELLLRVAIQEYTQGEAAHMLGVSLRTVVRRYAQALDCLTEILLERKLMRIQY